MAAAAELLRDGRDLVGPVPGPTRSTPLMVVVEGQRADLQRRAVRLATRWYAEALGAFVERLGANWRAWYDHGDELPAGELAAIA